MTEASVAEASRSDESEATLSQQTRGLRPMLLLASIAALLSLHAELAVLEQLDSLSLYMKRGEIALDAGVALLILLALALVWWLLVLALVGVAEAPRFAKQHCAALAWYLGLSIPFSYLILDLFGAIKALVLAQWQPKWFVWLLIFVFCVVGLLKIRVPKLQEFCRTRLVPIAWAHIALAIITAGVLWADGVHLFRDYVHPGHTTTNSALPDVYLITLDALAAEDTSLYGYRRPTTPNLERFAKRSFVFDDFFANCNFTASATTSIETGKLPWSHRLFQQGGFLRGAAQQETLAAQLHQRGYYTAMITSNQWAAPFRHRTLESYDAVEYEVPLGLVGAWFHHTNLIGVNSQYTLYGALLQRLVRVLTYIDALLWPQRYPVPAEPVFDRARTLLERPHVTQPQFLWTHILPPHDPYLPPPLTRKRFLSTNKLTNYGDFLSLRNNALPPASSVEELRARYDEMVLYADATVGDFLDWLDRSGRLDQAIVIVSADHGESFEHGTFLHAGPFLYESMIRVPLLIHLPGQTMGTHISQLAQQADLLPTILDLLGAPPPTWTDGTSLQSAMNGRTLSQRFIFSMNLEPDRTSGPISKGTVAVRDSEFKYVIRLDRQEEALYQYKADPLEEHSLIISNSEVAKRLREVLLNKIKEINQRPIGEP